jgi:hypothetical protein
MKARKQFVGPMNLHAELYHRAKLDALRAEGERLRHELRRRGVDPAAILSQARPSRALTGRH